MIIIIYKYIYIIIYKEILSSHGIKRKTPTRSTAKRGRRTLGPLSYPGPCKVGAMHNGNGADFRANWSPTLPSLEKSGPDHAETGPGIPTP